MSLLKDPLSVGDDETPPPLSEDDAGQGEDVVDTRTHAGDPRNADGVMLARTAEQRTADSKSNNITIAALLKEDFNQFKEDVANVFKIRREDSSSSRSGAPQGDIITKQDLANVFKIRREDISAVFKPIPSINAFGIKTSSNAATAAARDQSGITNTFRIKASSSNVAETRDRRSSDGASGGKSSVRPDNGGGRGFFGGRGLRREASAHEGVRPEGEGATSVPKRAALESKGKCNAAPKMNVLKETHEKRTSKTLPAPGRTRLTPRKNEASKTLPRLSKEKTAGMSGALEAEAETEASSETEDPSQTDRCQQTPTQTNILSVLKVNSMFPTWSSVGGDHLGTTVSETPGDELWMLKQYACYVTLDRNTAGTELGVSEDGRAAVRRWEDHGYPPHPERFQRCPQVLCREGLCKERFYWEVEWAGGGADVGVAYGSICRDGDVDSCLIGRNAQSWSVECRRDDSYTACHDNLRSTAQSSPGELSHRVGMYLDWRGGLLSFYSVSEDSMSLIHTFHCAFTQPVYPAFWLWGLDSSVTLCHIVREWERLLL